MSKQAKHILVMLPNPLGDAVLCTPALRHLRNHFPQARLTLLGKKSSCELLMGLSGVDEFLTLDNAGVLRNAKWLRGFGFDGVVLLTNSFRSALLMKLANIPRRIGYGRDGRGWLLSSAVKPIRWGKRFAPISMLDYYGTLMDHAIGSLGGQLKKPFAQSDRTMQLPALLVDRQRVDKLFMEWGISEHDKVAVLVPGGAFGGSKWWPAERFGALADRLSDDGYKVVLLCAPNEAEREISRAVLAAAESVVYNLLDSDLSLPSVREVVRRAALMVSNDTGPCHIAAAYNVPLVTLFGPNDPRWTATGYDKEIRLRVDVDCGPCQKPVCVTDHRCLERIDVERVFQATQDVGTTAPAALVAEPYRVYEESYVPLDGGAGLVHQGYRELLRQNGLESLPEVFAYKKGLGASVVKAELTDKSQRATQVLIKRYESSQRLTSGARDFQKVMELAEKGRVVGRPISYGVAADGRSFFLYEPPVKVDAFRSDAAREKGNKLRSLYDRDGQTSLFLLATEDFKQDGLDELIKATKQMADDMQSQKKDFRILVVSGADWSGYWKQSNRLGLNQQLLFMGSTSELPALVQMADAVVVPTHNKTCSRLVLEALASGTPAITTRHNGAAEFLGENKYGIILDHLSDAKELAQAMLKFCDRDYQNDVSERITQDRLFEQVSFMREVQEFAEIIS